MLGCHFKLTTFLKIKVTIKIMRYKREIETQKDRLILGSNLRVTSSSVSLCGPSTFLSRKGVNTEFGLHYSNQICQEWSRTKIVFHFYFFLLWSSLVRLLISLSLVSQWMFLTDDFFLLSRNRRFPGLRFFSLNSFLLFSFFQSLSSPGKCDGCLTHKKATNFFFHARKKHFRSKTSSIQSWDNEEKKSLWTSKRSRRDVEALEGDDRDDCDGQVRQNRICSWTSETWKSFIESFF